jgi:hypothetical protein
MHGIQTRQHPSNEGAELSTVTPRYCDGEVSGHAGGLISSDTPDCQADDLLPDPNQIQSHAEPSHLDVSIASPSL